MTFFCCFFFLLLFASRSCSPLLRGSSRLLSLNVLCRTRCVAPRLDLRSAARRGATTLGPGARTAGGRSHPSTGVRPALGLDLLPAAYTVGSLPPELLLLSPPARLNPHSNSSAAPSPSSLRLPPSPSTSATTLQTPPSPPPPLPFFFSLHRLASSLATSNAYTQHFTSFFFASPGALSPSLDTSISLAALDLDSPEIFLFLVPPLSGNLLTAAPPQLASLPPLDHLELGYNSSRRGYRAQNLRNLLRTARSWPLIACLSPQALKLDLSDNRSLPDPALFRPVNLTLLSLMSNALSGPIPGPLGDLPNLEALNLWNNSLTGPLPQRLGSNRRLARLDASTNLLSGPIPPRLCAGNRLVRLILFSNRLGSEIPRGLATCSSLWRVRLESNNLTGPIPVGFGSLPNLTYLDLSSNSLSGAIPRDLCGAASLAYFNVSGNPLRRALPRAIWTAPRLQVFAAGYCGLTGEVPSFASGCSDFYRIDLEGNDLSGTIPSDVVRCDKLVSLKLDRNRLTGEIPREIAMLPSITEVDVSWNNLSGPIPPEFDNCSTLESLDVSFNRLTGPVPSTISSVMQFEGNVGLCGEAVDKPCGGGRGDDDHFSARRTAGGVIMLAGATAVAVAGLVVLAVGMRWSREGGEADAKGGAVGPGQWQMMAFQRLNFTAEDVAAACADRGSARVVGAGSTGTVYRAEMPNGEVIAVKELRLPHNKGKRGKENSNDSSKREAITVAAAAAEVEVLGSVRHRNIVRLLGWCRNNETVLLLYEYMPNGSLEKLLHGGKGAHLGWEARYRIAVGVAQGMSYLHHDCTPLVVHRDLKPSNILLDAEMEARVADFGLAKFMDGAVALSVSGISGSCSYIAPEYACTLKVDERSDIYSYGVVLMEIVSGRRSVEPEYGEGNSIVEWIRQKLVSGADDRAIWDVLDATIANCKEVRKEMMLVLRVAMLCTCKSPEQRPSMRDVLTMLQEAKPERKPCGKNVSVAN
ncbi:leucine-rich repeat receptor-like protein kinase TDR [Ananas comosus]|uniref:non-specific serine/threonine protein kinase n=1 Tax=Ananas comosus TaxID=4615 RepID=A0A6P5F6B6_ANACO|nr:leucine-rich repeat receptor-like protein kinase TDR [Ananas comosus]